MDITQCETFGAFARGLAADVNDYYISCSGLRTLPNASSPILYDTEPMALKPMYGSKAVKNTTEQQTSAKIKFNTDISHCQKTKGLLLSLVLHSCF